MTKEEKSNNVEGKLKTEQPARERSRHRTQKRDKVKLLTKIIIRHLPPTMTEEEFLKQIDPLPDHDFYYYAAADWSLGYDATCRAYINFKNYDDVFLFRDRFDGYVFVDSKGAEYPAIVEFAPFQGLAKNKSRKIDNKVNSIELEQHYKSFLEKLEEDRDAAKGSGESKLEFSLDRKKDDKITSTPLLQYLANKKEKRREESKRRTEEKRRLRDEERDRRQQRNPSVTKIMSNQDISVKKDAGKSGGGKDNASEKGDQPEDCKNSRSKRRAARDQRRREEHEQRKRERERVEREQREKGGAAAACVSSSENLKEKLSKESISSGKQENMNNKANARKPTEEVNRKEVKKYSERRERDRRRNRKEHDLCPAMSNSDTAIIAFESAEPAEDEPAINSTPTANFDEISDSVKNFIRSVATVKEFVPMHKQVEAAQVVDVQNVREELEKLALFINREKNAANEEASEETKVESMASMEEKQLQKQRLAEERRIRNKDRPSIAIYQPKPRLRLSEESDSKDTASKDVRSNPNSDCESLKKEEQHQRAKKPSRYSERRSERRSKDKRKDDANENDACETMKRKSALKKSKSLEECCDYNEKSEAAAETATGTTTPATTSIGVNTTESSQEIN